MKVLIFTEGGRGVGFGHITRCLSLYQAFKKYGITSQMIINGDITLAGLLGMVNYRLLNWANRKVGLGSILKGCDIAIIDSYLAGPGVYRRIARNAKIAVFIDDYNRIKYPKGIVINSNMAAKTFKFRNRIGTKYLLGNRFVLLRKEFWINTVKRINKKITHILVIFGGGDSTALTLNTFKILKVYSPDSIKNIVITAACKYAAELKSLQDAQTKVIYNASSNKIREIMLQADLAISASGQTLLELVRLGVPTIAVINAKNQIFNALSMYQKGSIALAGGKNDKNIANKILKKISEVQGYKLRIKMSRNGKKLVDGRGALRAATEILRIFRKSKK